MFKYQDLTDGLKSLSSAEDTPKGLKHCHAINFQAKTLGFRDYYDFQQTLKKTPIDELAGLSIGLMRRICEKRLPRLQDCPYFEFVSLPNNGVGYYSHWVGWDANGDEVRVPRPLIGLSSVQGMRKAVDYPVYVVESERELTAWQQWWRSTVYVPEALARTHFTRFFEKKSRVVANPPMDLVEKKANSGRYNNNFAGDDEV